MYRDFARDRHQPVDRRRCGRWHGDDLAAHYRYEVVGGKLFVGQGVWQITAIILMPLLLLVGSLVEGHRWLYADGTVRVIGIGKDNLPAFSRINNVCDPFALRDGQLRHHEVLRSRGLQVHRRY